MSSSTSRLQLTKLADSENFSNSVLNANWDKVDNGYGTLDSQINTYSTITPTAFSNRVNIVTSHCYKIGRWAIVYLQLHSNQAISENTVITGLPVPAQRMGLMVNVSGATAIVSTNQADGVFANGIPTNTDFIISGVYNTLQG